MNEPSYMSWGTWELTIKIHTLFKITRFVKMKMNEKHRVWIKHKNIENAYYIRLYLF